ncbi:MAG: glycosyltransferase, partial [Candidatus Nitrotoga sp.]
DDMAGRHNQSTQFVRGLRFYDVFLTTKTYNVFELQKLGCPDVRYIGNGYDPATFRPVAVSADDERRLGGEIGFIGSYEQARSEMLYLLASSGLNIRVWGGGWHRAVRSHPNLRIEKQPLYGDDFAKACAAFKINLGFLRKLNRDLQTTRSVEIPACGGFMLAERTCEHAELFAEGEEAEFFDSPEELLAKCRFYLAHEEVRRRIAERGYERCLRSDYSNAGRLAIVFPYLLARLEHKVTRVLS